MVGNQVEPSSELNLGLSSSWPTRPVGFEADLVHLNTVSEGPVQ